MAHSIEEIKQNYKDLFEYSSDYIFILDLEGKIIEINKILLQNLETSASKILSKNIWEFLVCKEDNQEENEEQQLKRFKTSSEPLIYKLPKNNENHIFIQIDKIPIKENNQVTSFLGIGHDITKQKKLGEQKFKESEERFRKLFKGTPNYVLAWQKKDNDFIITDYNIGAEKYTNGKISEALGATASQLYQIEQKRPDLIENLNKCYGEKSDFTKEIKYYSDFINQEQYLLITYSYIPPNIVLTHTEDITERKRYIQKLKESEVKFRSIIENAKEGYYETDLRGTYTFVNSAYCNFIEYSHEELIGQNYKDFRTEEMSEKTFAAFNKVYNTGIEQESFEFEMITKTENVKYGDTSIYLVYDEEGNKIGFRGFIKDVTEKKIAEEQLKESEEKFRLISENSNDLIRIVSNDYKFEYINENTHLKLLGYSNEDLIGKQIVDFLHPDEIKKNLNFAKKVREIGAATQENRLKHKDRHWVWFDTFAKEFFDKYGNSHGLLISRDITERKKAELELKESEEKFRRLFKGAPHHVMTWQKINNDFIVTDYNNATEELTDGRISNYIGKTASQLYQIEQNRPDLIENLNKCFDEKSNFSREFQLYIDFLGRERDLTVTYCYIPPNIVLTHSEDITGRKRAIQELEKSEKKYRNIIEKAKEGYYEVDIRGTYTFVNSAYCKLLEYSREEIIGKNYKNFTTEEMTEKAFTTFNMVYNTGIEQASFDYEMITKSGKIKYGDTSIHLIFDAEGNKIGFRGFLKETTEKKLAEEQLKKSEERFRKFFKGGPNVIIAWQKVKDDFILIDHNDGAIKVSNGKLKERVGQTASKIFIEEIKRPDLVENMNICFEQKKNYSKTVKRHVLFAGEERDLRLKYQYVPPDLVLTHSEDITERVERERELEESKEKFRKLFKGNPNFTIAWQKLNDDFVLIDHNDGAVKVSDGAIRERLGQTASQVYIKEINRPDLFEKLNICLETKKNFTIEDQQYITFLGKERIVKTKYSYLPPDIVLNHMEDITERKIQEQTLKESEQKFRDAYERENFYKDLFAHDMSNILQGMLTSLELCNIMLKNSNQIENLPKMLENLKDQIHRGANLVKNVRKFSELQDSEIILRNFTIKDVVEKAINIVKKSQPTKTINIQIESSNDNITIKSDEFLIDVFENILFNAVKHNNNSIVDILIKISEIQEDNNKSLKIEFIDNGYGIDDSRKRSIFKRGYRDDRSVVGIGLGLSLVNNILNRYSAKIWVENKIPEDYSKGSNFIIQYPLIS
ncbi:MAG: PAS domain S-box protein [Promethearchaeota archaeon]